MFSEAKWKDESRTFFRHVINLCTVCDQALGIIEGQKLDLSQDIISHEGLHGEVGKTSGVWLLSSSRVKVGWRLLHSASPGGTE